MPADDRARTGDEPEVDHLAAYWDRVLASAPADSVPPPTIEPSLATTIRRLHAVDDAPAANPVFGRRLLEDLMHTAPDVSLTAFPAFGPPLSMPHALSRARSSRLWWALAEIAAVIALAIGLAGGYLLYDRQGTDDGTSVTGFVATPDVDQPPAFFGTGGTVTILSKSGRPIQIDLTRLTLAPGAELHTPTGEAYEYAILAGELMHSQVDPSGEAAHWSTGGNGGSGTSSLMVRNESTAPAVMILALIGSDAATWQPGAGVQVERLASGEVSLPDGDAYGEFERSSLLSHQSENHDTGRDGLTVIAVDTGQVRLRPDAGALTVFTSDGNTLITRTTGGNLRQDGVVLEAGDAAMLQRGAAYTVENETYEPAAFIRLTISPNSALLQPLEGEVTVGEGGEVTTEVTETPATPGPTVSPIATSDPADCTIAPRTAESLRYLADNLSGDPDEIIADMFKYGLGVGVPADPATVLAIEATLHEFATCGALGDMARFFAFFTDRFLASTLLEGTGEEILAPRPPQPMSESLVWDVRIQEDGRVTARSGDASEHSFITFVNQGDRWLIDNVDNQIEIGTPPAAS